MARLLVVILVGPFLAAAVWFVWAFPGPRIAAALGVGPTTGVVTVSDCRLVKGSGEGSGSTVNCGGTYVANGGGPATQVQLQMASRDYAAGTRVPVRMVGGRPYQKSALDFALWALVSLYALGVPVAALVLLNRAEPPGSDTVGSLAILFVLLALPLFVLFMVVGAVVMSFT
ncbi:hypothetical protein [Streptacidiphilus sp. MAP12-33]|uniref:hypothetical protein n=1 Tax=Streptacidiphilus sp. MAP12-33 TaxID=3156266 RepID=UPI003513451B